MGPAGQNQDRHYVQKEFARWRYQLMDVKTTAVFGPVHQNVAPEGGGVCYMTDLFKSEFKFSMKIVDAVIFQSFTALQLKQYLPCPISCFKYANRCVISFFSWLAARNFYQFCLSLFVAQQKPYSITMGATVEQQTRLTAITAALQKHGNEIKVVTKIVLSSTQ